jgi:hypothetical protein
MTMSKEKQTPQERYHAKYRRDYIISCMTHTEGDIINKLDSVKNRTGYIKDLVREDIKKQK